MKANKFRRGQIWWCADSGILGTELKTRPVIIVSNDIATEFSTQLSVVPLTTQQKRMDLPTHVLFEVNGGESVACCENILTTNINNLETYLATCTEETMNSIDDAIKEGLGI